MAKKESSGQMDRLATVNKGFDKMLKHVFGLSAKRIQALIDAEKTGQTKVIGRPADIDRWATNGKELEELLGHPIPLAADGQCDKVYLYNLLINSCFVTPALERIDASREPRHVPQYYETVDEYYETMDFFETAFD